MDLRVWKSQSMGGWGKATGVLTGCKAQRREGVQGKQRALQSREPRSSKWRMVLPKKRPEQMLSRQESGI